MTVGELRSAGVILPARSTPVVIVAPDGQRYDVAGLTEVIDTQKTAEGGRRIAGTELRLHVGRPLPPAAGPAADAVTRPTPEPPLSAAQSERLTASL